MGKTFTITCPEGTTTWTALPSELDAVPPEFRAKLDSARPGDIFEVEGFDWECFE
jgi:hypothetical protein